MNATSPQEFCIPHAVVFETDTQYRARVTRFKHRAGQMADTAVFQKIYKGKNADGTDYAETKNCVVGMEAINSAVRVVGADKYRLGYFDVYVCGMLLKMFPEGHDNIALSMAHPPDAIPYLETMGQTLLGRHTVITPEGKTVKFVVKVVTPFDEPAGGAVRAITSEFRSNDFVVAGDKILLVDIGGKISSITPCVLMANKTINTLFNYGEVFEIGIQNVQKDLEDILRSQHPALFTRQIPHSILDECIRKRGLNVTVQGRSKDFSEEYTQAVAPLINAVENIYISQMGRALDSRLIFVSGGGGGLIFDELRDTVFEQETYLADAYSSIHMANVRGIYYATAQYLESARHGDFKSLFKKDLAVVCEDAGNSQNKGISYVIAN